MLHGLTRLNKFLIRNTGLLSVQEMANFLGTTPTHIQRRMKDLGLPAMEVLDKNRAFPILLRRNHDLLSHEALAGLVGMPLEVYHRTRQEMDMLDVKLGEKPEGLEALAYREDERDHLSARGFQNRCRPYLDDYAAWEKPFSFLGEMAREENESFSPPQDSRFALRMMYSYTASHGDFLLTGEDFYSEGILSRLRNRGVNAGWMPALLRDLAPSTIFEGVGEDHVIRLQNLRKQVDKALSYGIRIYLYLNEPRFMPEAFFRKYPHARGLEAPQRGHYGLCTSDPSVRDWLYESTRFIFSEVPDLGGVILITASEHETNCCSHVSVGGIVPGYDPFWFLDKTRPRCPRCQRRGPQAVLTDVANLTQRAAKSRGSNAEVVQWLWGWDYIMPMESIKAAMDNLDPGVIVMVDMGKYKHFTLFGKDAFIDEYTLTHPIPSDYARELVRTAKSRGRKVLARCALVTTSELNAVPYLPVLRNVEDLLKELKKLEVDGLLGCWVCGAYPHRNMELLNYLSEENPMRSLAFKYYGRSEEEAVKAWTFFSEAVTYYPAVQSVLYFSAINPGPGLRFSLTPEPWRHGMVALATERVEEISGPLGADILIKGFRKTAELFSEGLSCLRTAIDQSDRKEYREANLRDFGIARACMLHLRSAANYTEFILVRNRWEKDQTNAELRLCLVQLLTDELENARAMLELSKRDSRIGYEGAIGYFYQPMEIIEKIYDLQVNLERLKTISFGNVKTE